MEWVHISNGEETFKILKNKHTNLGIRRTVGKPKKDGRIQYTASKYDFAKGPCM